MNLWLYSNAAAPLWRGRELRRGRRCLEGAATTRPPGGDCGLFSIPAPLIVKRKNVMTYTIRPALGLLAALLLGCESARTSTTNAEGPQGIFHHASQHEVSTREYRVDPPDEILVKSPNIKELDGQKQKVRPDGKITLNLVDEVYVAGKTPDEINELLKRLVAKYYANPDIKVEVIANSKFYYVFGFSVARQGQYAYTGRDTIITALAQAGFGQGAWPQQVRLSRPARNGQENATAVIDFKRIWGYGDMSQNYLLQEGDIIEVPDSPLWAWNKKMTDVLGPITGTAGVVTAGTSMAGAGGARTAQ